MSASASDPARAIPFRPLGMRLAGDESGSVSPLFAVMLVLLLASAGLAFDMGRLYLLQSHLSASLDAAGLAAGADITAKDDESVAAIARAYMAANFPEDAFGSTFDPDSITADVDAASGSIISLKANAKMNTTFLRLFGITTMSAAAVSEITRSSKGLELALALDNTLSMDTEDADDAGTRRIDALIAASKTLIESLSSGAPNDNLWIGIVPYSQAVNVGSLRATNAGWMAGAMVSGNYEDGNDWGTYLSTDSSYPSEAKFTDYERTRIQTESRRRTQGTNGNGTSAGNSNNWYVGDNENGISPSTSARISAGNAWAGCVDAETDGNDITDAVPSGTLNAYYWPTQDESGVNDGNDWKEVSNSNQNSNWSAYSAWTCVNPATGVCSSTYEYRTRTRIHTYGTISYDDPLPTDDLSQNGPNKSCPQEVTPLTADYDSLITAIEGMKPVGYTHINLGAVWAWRMLSPNWRGQWGGDMDDNDLPLEYGTKNMIKAVVLMTDGENRMPSTSSGQTAYGYLSDGNLGTTNSTSTAITALDDKTEAVCTAMKNNNIYVYTVVLGTDSVNKTLMSACATSEDFYFDAPTSEELEAAFATIADSLSNLRVSH